MAKTEGWLDELFRTTTQADAASVLATIYQPDEFGMSDADRRIDPEAQKYNRFVEYQWRFRASYSTADEAKRDLCKAWIERVTGRALWPDPKTLPRAVARDLAAEQDRLGMLDEYRREYEAYRKTGVWPTSKAA